MKHVVLLLVLAVLVGCSSNSANPTKLPENNVKNQLLYGRNILDYDNTKQLNILTYRAGDKNGLYTDKSTYTVSSDNNLFAKENIYNKKAAVKPLSAKEKLNEEIRNFQMYAENAGLKPIERNDNTMYKTAPQTVEVGTQWNNLYALDVDTYQFKTISATCIAVSNHAYFFLEDGLAKLTEDKIQTITEAFDKNYEIIHQYYGTETDTDGNGKVSFLIYDIREGVLGFFNSADKYKSTEIPAEEKSNESDILYVNYKYFDDKKWTTYSADITSTFIHEFQHMVFFDNRSRAGLSTNVDVWIQEGLSMLAEYYGGYGATHRSYIGGYFNEEQGKSLITDDSTQNYGLSYLFIRYLQIRFGDDVVKKIYASNRNGTQMIEDVTGMDFDELFADFVTMVLVTGRGVTTDKRYNIDEFNATEGTEIYNLNGFNLAQLIDEVYSYNAANPLFITNTGNTKELSLYGFHITKWSSQPKTLTLQGDNKTKGIYYAW